MPALTMPASETYAEELYSKGYGYPMWYPEPYKGVIPELGDVGFIHHGRFVRFFNVTKPGNSHYNKEGLPENFATLEYSTILSDDREKALQAKVISSHSVSSKEVGANVGVDATPAGVPVGAQVEYEYTRTRERGAMLLLKDDAVQYSIFPNSNFPDYMKRNHGEWLKWAKTKGFKLKMEQVILVQGAWKTTQWTVAAFEAASGGQTINLQGTFLSAGSVGFKLKGDVQRDGSMEYRSGPDEHNRAPSPSPAPSVERDPSTLQLTPSGQSSLHSTHSRSRSADTSPPQALKNDQCVFLPHYKIKYRFVPFHLFPRKIEAGAGPHNLPGPDNDSETAPAVPVVVADTDDESGDEDAGAAYISGPVDVVLEYILNNSDAEIAIACDGDVNSLFVATEHPSNLQQWLEIYKPIIDVENGLGKLSLKEAVVRERKATLEKMTKDVNTPLEVPENEGGGEGGDGDGDDEPGGFRSQEPKTITGEGQCLLGKDLPDGGPFEWPHLMLSEDDLEGSAISSVSLAPGGELLATGSDDSTVRIWNIKTGRLLKKWQTHEDVVWSVSFSPDGRHVASGSADNLIILWDALSRHEEGEVGRLEGHEADVWTVVYSPDGTKLASGSVDNTVKIWDPIQQQELRTLVGHTAQIMHLAFTSGGSRIVSCAEASGRIWDVETGAHLATLQGHTGAIWSMAMSHAGDRVITGSEDHSARIWDCESGQELVTINEHTGPIWAVSFSPDDSEVVTGSYDSTLTTNDSFSGEHHQSFTERSAIIDSVGYSSDGKYIASGAADGNVKLWNRDDGSMIAEWRGHSDKCKSATFVNGNRDVLTSSDDGSARMWSVRDVLRLV